MERSEIRKNCIRGREAKQSISRRGFNRLHHQEALLQLLDVRVESVMRSKADVR